MASWAPACCMCWAMAQAMLRLLATPNTTTVRPSMLIGIRESSSAGAIELIGAIFKDISRKVGCLGELCRPYGARDLCMARDPALTRWATIVTPCGLRIATLRRLSCGPGIAMLTHRVL